MARKSTGRKSTTKKRTASRKSTTKRKATSKRLTARPPTRRASASRGKASTKSRAKTSAAARGKSASRKSGDFGVPVSKRRAARDVSRQIKRNEEELPRAGTQSREAGVGGVEAGPGSFSGGDVDTEVVGIGDGVGVAQSGPDQRKPGASASSDFDDADELLLEPHDDDDEI